MLHWDQYFQRKLCKLADLILSSSLVVAVVIFMGIRILFVSECGLSYTKEEIKQKQSSRMNAVWYIFFSVHHRIHFFSHLDFNFDIYLFQ